MYVTVAGSSSHETEHLVLSAVKTRKKKMVPVEKAHLLCQS